MGQMKQFIILVGAIMVIASFFTWMDSSNTEPRIPSLIENVEAGGWSSDVRVEEHYGCEYIVVDSYTRGPGGITHKGNCKFCIKRNKK